MLGGLVVFILQDNANTYNYDGLEIATWSYLPVSACITVNNIGFRIEAGGKIELVRPFVGFLFFELPLNCWIIAAK